MAQKIILTGGGWADIEGVSPGGVYDVIEVGVYDTLKFIGDDGDAYWGYPRDEPGNYSLGCDVIEWPEEVKVGDKIRATRGENLLVGTVDRLEGDQIWFLVGNSTVDWFLSPEEGFSVEVTKRAPRKIAPGMYHVAPLGGYLWVFNDYYSQYTAVGGSWIDTDAKQWETAELTRVPLPHEAL